MGVLSKLSSKWINEITIGNGGLHDEIVAGDFWDVLLLLFSLIVWSGFWKVYTVSAGRWWPLSYAEDIVCGRSVFDSCAPGGGHVDIACDWFVAVEACDYVWRMKKKFAWYIY